MADERGQKVEQRIAEWRAMANRKHDAVDPIRGYDTRHQREQVDSERLRHEAASAAALIRQYLSED